MGLFQNSRGLEFVTNKLQQIHRQVRQTEEKNAISWRRRMLGRVVLNESPLNKSKSSG